MRIFDLKRVVAVLCCVPIAAFAADGEAIMLKGAANPTALPCITCHGADGKGTPSAGFPRLAGHPAEYLAKQLRDFKAGTRQNPIMQPIATALTDEEIDEVARAYSARPRVNVTPSKARLVEGTGAWLAMRGAWSRNIPECILCHGPDGVGVGGVFPPIAGQSAMYLESQLRAWKGVAASTGKTGKVKAVAPTRRNDPNGLMQHIARDLTDAEIKLVSEYFESLGESSEPFNESQHRLR
ncbi:MAG: c-type cytochrome [Burkholderiales bacterium]